MSREVKYDRNIISLFNSDSLYRYNIILFRYNPYNYIIVKIYIYTRLLAKEKFIKNTKIIKTFNILAITFFDDNNNDNIVF